MKPVRVLSLGAGVQSSTMLYMMIKGLIEPADHVIFADTGWEGKTVYNHLETLRKAIEAHNMTFHKVQSGNIRDDLMTGDKRSASLPMFIRNPDGSQGMVRRQCTADYKLKPLMAKQRELAGLLPGERCKEHRITTLIGISWDETQRMRDPAFPWIQHEYPLVNSRMTRQDCLDWCDHHNYPTPPRSACLGCPFKSKSEWQHLKSKPDDWLDVVEVDNNLRTNPNILAKYKGTPFLHRSLKPLQEVDLRTDDEMGIVSLFDQECQGMCGI